MDSSTSFEAMPFIVNDPGHSSLTLQTMDELRKKRCFCDVSIAVEVCVIYLLSTFVLFIVFKPKS